MIRATAAAALSCREIRLQLRDARVMNEDQPSGAGGKPEYGTLKPDVGTPPGAAAETLTFIIERPGPKSSETTFEPGVSAGQHQTLDEAFAPGTALQDRYLIERELGRGGMGQVYRATDRRLSRQVAIKVSLLGEQQPAAPELADVAAEAFEREARLGANLSHPAIASIHDYGFHQGFPFAVFEYLSGESLRERLSRVGSIPLEEAQQIIGALAKALDYAHGRHVVHRDLKPDNIRCTEHGDFKILDLGLAKQFQREMDWRGFSGTPAYAAPEQAAGLPCDGRTDQYALALVAYEMLTGQRVFAKRNVKEMLECQRTVIPTWVTDPKNGLPEAVREALAKALSKSPSERFESCCDFAVGIGCRFIQESRPAVMIVREAAAMPIGAGWLARWAHKYGGLPQRISMSLITVAPIPVMLARAYHDLLFWLYGRLMGWGRLVLTPDSLYSAYHGDVERIVLRNVTQVSPADSTAASEVFADQRVERAFESHRYRVREIRMAGLACLVVAGVLAVIWFFQATNARQPVAAKEHIIFFAIIAGIIANAWGLALLHPWARWVTFSGSAVCLCFLGWALSDLIRWSKRVRPQFGFGVTVRHVLIFLLALFAGRLCWILWSESARHIFSREYRNLRKQLQRKQKGEKTLRVVFVNSGSTQERIFRLRSPEASAAMGREIQARLSAVPATAEDVSNAATTTVAVALIKSRPTCDYQILGSVEADGENREEVHAGLIVRGAILGSGAVVGVVEERLPGFESNLLRMRAVGARSVTQAGGTEFASHWFAARVARLAPYLLLITVAHWLLELAGVAIGIIPRTNANVFADLPIQDAQVAMVNAIHAWPILISLGLYLLRWPQLIMPTATSAMILTMQPFLWLIAGSIGFSENGGANQPAHSQIWRLIILDPFNLTFAVAALLLFKTARRSLAELREFFPPEVLHVGSTRTAGRTFAWCVTCCFGLLVILYVTAGNWYALASTSDDTVVWKVDNLTQLEGEKVTAVGNPHVKMTTEGPVVEFDGRGDGLFLDMHPLAGAKQFTIEVIFRPDADGAPEQRFFHMQQNGSEDRVVFQTRSSGGGQWHFETFIRSGEATSTLSFAHAPHPAGRWYHAAIVVDANGVRQYVNGALVMAEKLSYRPLGAGKTSLGTRLDRTRWFKGAIRAVRFTRRPLVPKEFNF